MAPEPQINATPSFFPVDNAKRLTSGGACGYVSAMARPRKGAEKARTAMMGFRTTQERREGLEAIAERRELPLSDIANEAFDEYLARHLKPKKRRAA
jgi:hypothetical protein